MGLELALLPFDSDHKSLSFSRQVLECVQNYNFFDEIKEIEEEKGQTVPECFLSHFGSLESGEHCYGPTLNNGYGEPLKYLRTLDLMDLIQNEGVRDNKNQAIWSYLSVR